MTTTPTTILPSMYTDVSPVGLPFETQLLYQDIQLTVPPMDLNVSVSWCSCVIWLRFREETIKQYQCILY